MKILLTNDDGINSRGIQKLAELLRVKGHKVFVIAPDANRSGISNAISILNNPVKIFKLEEDTWSCSGYPADCVIAGVMAVLAEKPDLVLSGINQGANLGTDLIYSGTAAAARQASIGDIPAVALSLAGNAEFFWDMAAAWSVDHLEELVSFWRKDSFVNVNIPNSPDPPAGLVLTRPALKNYQDIVKTITAPDGSLWCFLVHGQESIVEEEGTDCDAVSKKLAAVSSIYNYPVLGPIDPNGKKGQGTAYGGG